MPRRSDDSVRVGLNCFVRSQQLVEVGEALRPVDEGDDGRRLLLVHAGGDVDEHDGPHEVGPGVDERHRGHAAERHAHDAAARRGPAARWRRRRRPRSTASAALPSAGPSLWPWPGRSMATSGRSSAMRHRVPGVGVLRAAVEEHQLGRTVAPHERAEVAAPGHLDLGSRRTVGGPVVGQPELRGVLVEQPELVVRHLGHRPRLARRRGRRRPDRRWRDVWGIRPCRHTRPSASWAHADRHRPLPRVHRPRRHRPVPGAQQPARRRGGHLRRAQGPAARRQRAARPSTSRTRSTTCPTPTSSSCPAA